MGRAPLPRALRAIPPRGVINFDHNATTPIGPAARAEIVSLLDAEGGNPSSVHALGRATREVVETARRQVAAAVGATPLGVTFTSGGTEADNLALCGAAGARRARGEPDGIATSCLEHPAVARAVAHLAQAGHRWLPLPVDRFGRLDPEEVAQLLASAPDVGVVSVSAANHEIGTITPIGELVAAIRAVRPKVWIHCDAVQAFGKMEVDFGNWDLDLMSVSSHKIYGPPGAGALVHRQQLPLSPRSFGGSQERGRRVGTEGWLAVAGFGAAAHDAGARWATDAEQLRELSARLRAGIEALGRELVLTTGAADTTPNTSHFRIPGASAELVCMNLDLEGFAVSTGAACSSGTVEPSPVLLALGLEAQQARECIRISLGRSNTAAEIDAFVAALGPIVDRVRSAAQRRLA